MKLIYQARDITEAYIVSGLLNSHDIDTHVGGLYLQGGVGELAAFDFANIHVADEDVILAASVIAEYEGEQQQPITVIDGKSAGRKFKLLVVLVVSALIVFTFHLLSSEY